MPRYPRQPFLGLIFFLLTGPSLAEIPFFTANYVLHQGPLKVGTIELSYRQLPNGAFQLTSVTEPDGVIALIRDDVVTEQSTFNLIEGLPHPLHYSYHQTGEEDERHVVLEFDWPSNMVTNKTMEHSWRMDIPEETQDKASIQLALMQQLTQGVESPEFSVADGGKLKQYRFTRQAEELLEVGGHETPTIKMTLQKNQQPINTTFWVAADYHFLPVRVEKEKKLGIFSMDLVQAQFQNAQTAENR